MAHGRTLLRLNTHQNVYVYVCLFVCVCMYVRIYVDVHDFTVYTGVGEDAAMKTQCVCVYAYTAYSHISGTSVRK